MRDPVIVVDYDPAWPAQYAREAESLLRGLGDAHSIENIGSTAVPGLAAKPVIDILLAVDDAALLDVSAEEQAMPGRLYFYRRKAASAHVHVAHRDSWFVHDQLLFCDRLRAHPNAAAAYAALKRGLAGRFRDDRIAYTNAKADFIRGVLLRAGGIAPWLHE